MWYLLLLLLSDAIIYWCFLFVCLYVCVYDDDDQGFMVQQVFFSFHFVCLLAKFALANFFCKKKGKKNTRITLKQTESQTHQERNLIFFFFFLFFLYKNHHYQSYPSLNFWKRKKTCSSFFFFVVRVDIACRYIFKILHHFGLCESTRNDIKKTIWKFF